MREFMCRVPLEYFELEDRRREIPARAESKQDCVDKWHERYPDIGTHSLDHVILRECQVFAIQRP